MFSFIFSALFSISSPSEPAKDFWAFWGDGQAELSAYKTTTNRYGEKRSGYQVLIFVTEDISRKTRIKVESDDIPESERLPVLKLNRVHKFTTGVYDYSILTSTFSAIDSEFGHPSFFPMKISMTAQEWCGHVFQMLTPGKEKS